MMGRRARASTAVFAAAARPRQSTVLDPSRGIRRGRDAGRRDTRVGRVGGLARRSPADVVRGARQSRRARLAPPARVRRAATRHRPRRRARAAAARGAAAGADRPRRSVPRRAALSRGAPRARPVARGRGQSAGERGARSRRARVARGSRALLGRDRGRKAERGVLRADRLRGRLPGARDRVRGRPARQRRAARARRGHARRSSCAVDRGASSTPAARRSRAPMRGSNRSPSFPRCSKRSGQAHACERHASSSPSASAGRPAPANGGYVAGVLARGLVGAVEVTLRAAAPLATPLDVGERRRGRARAHARGERARARRSHEPRRSTFRASPDLSLVEAHAGDCRAMRTHPFPRDFVCGPARAPGDGLRIFPGVVAGQRSRRGAVDARRVARRRGGEVAPEFLWAALDSPSSFPLARARVRARARADGARAAVRRARRRASARARRALVLAWPIALEGRRGIAGAALIARVRTRRRSRARDLDLARRPR